MAIFGSIDTLGEQMPRTPVFAIARAYLAELRRVDSAPRQRLQTLTRGETQRHELGEGAFVLEQAYDTRLAADTFFETHRKYIDVQVIVAGEEVMAVADIVRGTAREPYNPERDLIKYDDVPNASAVRVSAGEGTVFFPCDIHMGGLRTGAAAVLVRKAVLKLPVA